MVVLSLALDVPVPSPCAQRWEVDGRLESVSHYVYGADRFLEQVLTDTDTDADGLADAVVTFTHDAAGKPLTARHGDRTTDCRTSYCTTNWVPVCPAMAECTRNALGLINVMSFGTTRVTNDYRCWTRDDGIRRYQRPADVPSGG